MALDPLSDWTARLLAMPQVDTPFAGATNLANFYGDLADKVQADSPDGSTVGIFTFDRITFASTLISNGFTPDGTTAWAGRIASAYETALLSSVIASGTVTNSAWTISNTDTLTAGTGGAVITTISGAKSTLEAGLINATTPFQSNTITNPSDADPAIENFAKAWRDATLAFVFNCIGLAGPPPTPLALTFPAK